MNRDSMQGQYEQIKGKIKETWGRLTDDEVALYNGKQEQFLGKLQERYGLAKDQAQEQLNKFEKDCDCNTTERGTY